MALSSETYCCLDYVSMFLMQQEIVRYRVAFDDTDVQIQIFRYGALDV